MAGIGRLRCQPPIDPRTGPRPRRGEGAHLARESADVVLIGNDLAKFAETVRIARNCRRIILQNFYGTLIVDTVGIGLAAVGLLNPLLETRVLPEPPSPLPWSGRANTLAATDAPAAAMPVFNASLLVKLVMCASGTPCMNATPKF